MATPTSTLLSTRYRYRGVNVVDYWGFDRRDLVDLAHAGAGANRFCSIDSNEINCIVSEFFCIRMHSTKCCVVAGAIDFEPAVERSRRREPAEVDIDAISRSTPESGYLTYVPAIITLQSCGASASCNYLISVRKST